MTEREFEETLTEKEQHDWDTEKVFKTVAEWTEDDGSALFFRLDAGEPPEVTSPVATCFDFDYFTHWTPLPNVLQRTNDYRKACIQSGIVTTFSRTIPLEELE